MSYPKKIVDSYIQDEYLAGRPNFRYKKVNILLGANASGKTSIGKMLMDIFNFIVRKEYGQITKKINDPGREARFVMDFVTASPYCPTSEIKMYRINVRILPNQERKYSEENIKVCVQETSINKKDNYETCATKLSEKVCDYDNNYMKELERITNLSWLFEYPADLSGDDYIDTTFKNVDLYLKVLQNVLHTLDPAIKKVEKIQQVNNTYVIRMENNKDVVVQDGKVVDQELLSSGTREGLEVAGVLTSILGKECGFYYCDEKFSYINSDVEKAILTVMINSLRKNDQLFFTTHNKDILDLPLPKHSFSLLKKEKYEEGFVITCVSASKYLKRASDSLRNAVDNDLFSTAPDLDLIYQLLE